MARLQTLLLPNGGFGFVLDEFHGDAMKWAHFAERCGARDILITVDTIRILEPFAESPTEPDADPEPEPGGRFVVPISLRTPSEAERRLLAAIFGECDCATDAKHPPTDDEPATDNPPSGDDGAPAESSSGTVSMPCCMPSAEAARFAFDPADYPTAEEISARVAEKVRAEGGLVAELIAAGNEQLSGNLTEREKRVEKILASSGIAQRLDESGAPVGPLIPTGPVTVTVLAPDDDRLSAVAWPVDPAISDAFTQSQLVASHVAPPLDVDASPDPLFGNVAVPLTKGERGPQIGTATVTPDGEVRAMIGEAIDAAAMQRHVDDAPRSGDWAPDAPVSERLCGAVNGKGEPCRQPSGHPYLHKFERVTL